MNWVDGVIIAIILLSAVVGLARGLLREVMSLAVWAAAAGVGYLYHKPVAAVLTAYVAQPTVRLVVAYAVLALGVLIVGAVVGALLGALVDKAAVLRWTDRLLGALFGAARGGVLVAMVVYLAALTPMADEPWWQDSPVIAQCKGAADWLLSKVPPQLQDQFKRV
ncbi:CvpA family protein [uncultured Thiodictyon sp.]|uniref:CvpA family protein n=1 Tax=uncultured Thiodictyon sp. TaxID=1846217 RepID=UPI0025F6C5BF|nr:CvpA family protein [uncultured Thiodictyon sp.]